MSFYSIKNPEERDAVIADYLATKKRIQQRNMNERAQDLAHSNELQEIFHPVIQSTKKSTEAITKELVPMQEEMKNINANLQHQAVKTEYQPKLGSKRRRLEGKHGPLVQLFLRKYLDGEVDTTFGIRHTGGNWRMGDKDVKFKDDNIIIDGELYVGTPGFWSLVTDKQPVDYSTNDYERYVELLHETSVLYRNNNPESGYPRASKSLKWKNLLSPIWDKFQEEGITSDSYDEYDDRLQDGGVKSDNYDGEDEEDDDFQSTKGDGVNPIPGCKIYLQKQGRCFNVRATGNGINFSPRPLIAGMPHHNGVFLRVGPSVYDGKGLLLGSHSPFRNIPILGWIL